MRFAFDRLAIALALPAAAFGLYLALGDATIVGEQHATRIVDGSAPVLARYLRRHPDDERAWVLLARALATDEHFPEAAEAYRRAVAFPKVARDPGVWIEYADALAMARGGSLAGTPTELIEKALALDARHAKALELAGSAAYERRDFAAAVQYWRTALAQMPRDSAQARELTRAIDRSERMARVGLPSAG